jgi:hypothetical protein
MLKFKLHYIERISPQPHEDGGFAVMWMPSSDKALFLQTDGDAVQCFLEAWGGGGTPSAENTTHTHARVGNDRERNPH